MAFLILQNFEANPILQLKIIIMTILNFDMEK